MYQQKFHLNEFLYRSGIEIRTNYTERSKVHQLLLFLLKSE